jgi:hypothetical protein
MDVNKLVALKEKYSDENEIELESASGNEVPYAGVSTLLDMPYQQELKDIDIGTGWTRPTHRAPEHLKLAV